MITNPLKRVADIIAGQSPSSDDVEPFAGGQPFLQGNAEFGEVTPNPRLQCPVAPKVSKPGDILLSVRAPVGAVNMADQRYGIGRGLCAIRAEEPVRGYLWWYLQSQASELRAMSTGSTFEAVSAADVGSLAVPTLSPSQMTAIACFLDRETAKIDALIGKQELLIDTLREDRAATITQVVTKGLDPKIEMQDSGVEAIGCIPRGWNTLRLKMLLAEPLTYGANAAADDDNPEHPRYIRITDIAADGSLRTETFRSLPPEVAAPYLLSEGDILFARSGSVGKTFMYKSELGPCCFAGYLIRARLDQTKMNPSYFKYFTATASYWNHIANEQIQATIQNVSAERYNELVVTVPSLAVQGEIVAFLDDRCSKIDSLINRSAVMIKTLREYRSALITNAVTGTIDDRKTG